MKYKVTEKQREDIHNRFTYHTPKDGQPERYTALRQQALGLAMVIASSAPPSREQSLALTKLEESIMFANAAIARNE
jgi:hypothetical protein